MEEVNFGSKVNKKLKEEAYDIIQNKMKLTIKEWIERKLKELIKNYNEIERRRKKNENE